MRKASPSAANTKDQILLSSSVSFDEKFVLTKGTKKVSCPLIDYYGFNKYNKYFQQIKVPPCLYKNGMWSLRA